MPDDENHIFLALCEVSPGVIWAGGFTSGIYKIEKKKGFKISYLSPAAIAGIRPDQYIYDIKKDSSGDVWSGGYYHLKRINLETKKCSFVSGSKFHHHHSGEKCPSNVDWYKNGTLSA